MSNCVVHTVYHNNTYEYYFSFRGKIQIELKETKSILQTIIGQYTSIQF